MSDTKELYEEEFDDDQLKIVCIMFEGMIAAAEAEDSSDDVRKVIIDQLTENKRIFISNVDRVVERLSKKNVQA